MVRIQFVNVKSFRLPILVQAERNVEARLPVEPGDVRANFIGFGFQILAVEVKALSTFAGVKRETGRVKTGAKPDIGVGGPAIFLEHLEDGQRTGGLIAMNARGQINAFLRSGGFADEGVNYRHLS